MILRYRPIKIWPEGWRESGRDVAPWSPFKADWRSTLTILGNELRHLGADEAILQLDTAEGNCLLDGGLRGDARVNYHGVILSLESEQYGTLTYPCNRYDSPRDPWRQNVRAIALGLESLRRVERYGIADRGQQYAGYAELPSGIALGAAMTVEQAAVFMCTHGLSERPQADFDQSVDMVIKDPQYRTTVFRNASKVLHPDNGSTNADLFRKLVQAKELLEAHA